MGRGIRQAIAILILVVVSWPVAGQQSGQQPPPPPPKPVRSPAQATAVPTGPAAVVNGQEISEVAVQRALKGISLDQQAEARSEVMGLLIDDLLIDQYLRTGVKVETKDV